MHTNKFKLSSPLVVVEQKSKYRICGDYPELNKKTILYNYTIPDNDDIIQITKGQKITKNRQDDWKICDVLCNQSSK